MTNKTTLSALTLAAILAATVGLTVPVLAQDEGAEPPTPPMDAPRGLMLFDLIDVNKDGTITAEEITAFRTASVSGTDANADGKLSAEELAARQVALMTRMAAARADRMVVELDVDGDKLLSVEELAARPMPGMRLDRLDANGDGSITRAEAEQADARMRDGRGRGDGPRGRGHRDGKGHGGPDNG